MNHLRFSLFVTLVVCAACGPAREDDDPVPVKRRDAGTATDAGSTTDAGNTATDAGPTTDAGTADAGEVFTDAGTTVGASIRICPVGAGGGVVTENCRDSRTGGFSGGVTDFGKVPVGTLTDQKLRIFNDGDANLRITTVGVTPGDNLFTVAPGSLPATIAPGGSTEFTLSFRPFTTVTNGTATLQIVTNVPNFQVVSWAMRGSTTSAKICVDPASIDFGSTAVGTTVNLSVQVTNCGQGSLSLTALTVVEGDATTNFAVSNGPALPRTLNANQTVVFNVSYTAWEALAVDSGLLVVEAGDLVTNVALTGRGEASCNTATAPTARIRVFSDTSRTREIAAGASISPGDTPVFDGSTSSSQAGGTVTYLWSITSAPFGSTATLQPSNRAQAVLSPTIAGTYRVELTVTDALGCHSQPAVRTLGVVAPSNDRLRVEVTWAEPTGDLDIHLLGPGGTFFNGGGIFGGGSDCFYQNCKPNSSGVPTLDWGLNGTTTGDNIDANDPVLDTDTIWGLGPEIISMATPFDATFTPVVHYYCSRQNSTAGTSFGVATARVRVFVDNVERLNVSKALTQRDVWSAASIVVAGGNVTVTASNAPVTKTTVGEQGCTADQQ